jgi:spastic paraplegia protein 7
MDHEARLLIAEAYRKTEELLQAHKENLKLMAEALLSKETLNYDDVEKLLGPPPHGKKHLVSIL